MATIKTKPSPWDGMQKALAEAEQARKRQQMSTIADNYYDPYKALARYVYISIMSFLDGVIYEHAKDKKQMAHDLRSGMFVRAIVTNLVTSSKKLKGPVVMWGTVRTLNFQSGDKNVGFELMLNSVDDRATHCFGGGYGFHFGLDEVDADGTVRLEDRKTTLQLLW